MITRQIKSERQVPLKTDPSRTKTVYTFKYLDESGKQVGKRLSEKCLHLKIPPVAWNVKIFPDAPKILATWQDEKGRDQKLYSNNHKATRKSRKFARCKNLAKNLKRIEQAILYDIGSANVKDNEAASVLWIIKETGFRIGGMSDTKADVRAYGISTLLSRHVRLVGEDRVLFQFVGKKGVLNRKTVNNSVVRTIIESRKSPIRNRRLFDVSSGYCLQYLKKIAGDFQIKDLRTIKGTAAAIDLIARNGPPVRGGVVKYKKWQRGIAGKVAKLLGNTRSIAMNSYIDPEVWNG